MKQIEIPNDWGMYHITWVTHNSRVSERMFKLCIVRGKPVILNNSEEVEITRYILQIVKEDKLIVSSYNICRDHIHMLLGCGEKDRDNIVRKLKGKSTQSYKDKRNIDKEFHLWAQKYSCTGIRSEEHLENIIAYIQHNREHHGLTVNKGLQPLVAEIVTPIDKIQEP